MRARVVDHHPETTFHTVSELDFSHLRAKGLEIRSSSLPSPVALVKVPTLLLPSITMRFIALHPTFLRVRLFQYLQLSYQ